MPDSHARATSARFAVAVLLVLAGVLSTVGPAAAAPRKARASYKAAIEPLARYQPQTTCSPRAKAGVVDLSRRLLRAYPGTRSLGIVRACAAGGRSEHKEGRAFDWGGLRASRAADRAKVKNFTTWLFAKDRHGNRYAMARRLGIQYVIWNRRIWGSYAAGSGWRRYTGANPHTDHVHISFTWAGARKRTSFWTGKVGNVLAAPKPTIPPPPPPPSGTSTTRPRPQPVPPGTLPSGPEVLDETVTLPANAARVLMTGALVAGQPYLVEAKGTYSYTKGGRADAECSTSPRDGSWRRDRSVHRADPVNDHLDLYVDGHDLWAQADNGRECDTTNHMYRWMYTPSRSGRVTFKVWDPTSLRDNTGALTIRVIKSAPADVLTWTVPGKAGTGRTSPGALLAGETYVATVGGVVDAGHGVMTDAECTATLADPVWRRSRDVAVAGGWWDDFDVLLDRDDVSAQPHARSDSAENCDSAGHTYSWLVKVDRTRPVNLRVDDPVPGDNKGSLTVRMERMPPVVGPEEVTVDSADADGTPTARMYPAGRTVLLRVTGTYTIAPGMTADAECSTTTSDPTWRSSRSELTSSSGLALGDVTVDTHVLDWRTASGARCDGTGHSYTLRYTPRGTGRIVLGVSDDRHSDNAGTLSVTVEPAG